MHLELRSDSAVSARAILFTLLKTTLFLRCLVLFLFFHSTQHSLSIYDFQIYYIYCLLPVSPHYPQIPNPQDGDLFTSVALVWCPGT